MIWPNIGGWSGFWDIVKGYHRQYIMWISHLIFIMPAYMIDTPYMIQGGLPRWPSGKESACQCKRHKKHRFHPWIRKIPWRRKPTPVFCLGRVHGHRRLSMRSGRVEHDRTRARTHTFQAESRVQTGEAHAHWQRGESFQSQHATTLISRIIFTQIDLGWLQKTPIILLMLLYSFIDTNAMTEKLEHQLK